MSAVPALFGAIEAGGTKFRCALTDAEAHILVEERIATTDPRATLAAVVRFFDLAQRQHGAVQSFGVGSFGPLQLRRDAPGYGHLLSTPKAGWSGADLLGPLQEAFGRPVLLDTDVNAAALAESLRGAGRGLQSLVYVTVGTGIGGGAVLDGHIVHGQMHPEMGHLLIRRDPRDAFAGVCPYHGDCLEGLVSGPAIMARWGRSLDRIAEGEEALDIVAGYLGQMVANLALLLSCQRIVIGGGVMTDGRLFAPLRRAARQLLQGYLPALSSPDAMDAFVVSPGLGDLSGLTGAALLAQQAAAQSIPGRC